MKAFDLGSIEACEAASEEDVHVDIRKGFYLEAGTIEVNTATRHNLTEFIICLD